MPDWAWDVIEMKHKTELSVDDGVTIYSSKYSIKARVFINCFELAQDKANGMTSLLVATIRPTE